MCMHIVDAAAAATAARCRYSGPCLPFATLPRLPWRCNSPAHGQPKLFFFFQQFVVVVAAAAAVAAALVASEMCAKAMCWKPNACACCMQRAHTHTGRQTDSLSSSARSLTSPQTNEIVRPATTSTTTTTTTTHLQLHTTTDNAHCQWGIVGRSGDRSDDSRMLIKASITGLTQAQSDASAGKTIPPSKPPGIKLNCLRSWLYIYTTQQINNRYVYL